MLAFVGPLELGPITLGDRSPVDTYEYRYQRETGDPPLSIDRLPISVESPGRLTVWTETKSPSEFDPFLTLSDNDNVDQRILTQSDDWDKLDARIQIHLQAGDYVVALTESPWADTKSVGGASTLHVQWEPTGPFVKCSGSEPSSCAYEVVDEPWGITTADLNGDGIPDLATANNISNDVTIFLGLGDGTFHQVDHAAAFPESPKFEVGREPVTLWPADFNQDGAVDLAVVNRGEDVISLLPGRSDGTFGVEIRIPLPRSENGAIDPRFVTADDLDLDGYPDLLVAGSGSREIFPLWNLGRGFEFEAAMPISVDGANGNSPNHVATADMDSDGYPDVIVPLRNGQESDSIVVLWNRSKNEMLSTADLAPDGRRILQEEPDKLRRLKVDKGAYVVAIADFDHDDRLDLATTNDKSGTVSVWLAPNEECKTREDYPVGADAEFLLQADLNGDGWQDLVTGNEDTRDLSILINSADGTGRFEAELRVPIFCQPDELTADDFDGDGRIDLAVVSRENQLLILLGLGDGTFVRSTQPRVGNRPEVIVWEDLEGNRLDFNRDGLPDLAVANSLSDDISILLGRGDRTFQPTTFVAVGSVPRALIGLDLNQDGRTDLVTANELSDDVSILLGYGDGRFTAPISVAVGDSPSSLLAEDLDGDGLPDLVTANRVSNSVSVVYAKDVLAPSTVQKDKVEEYSTVPPTLPSEPSEPKDSPEAGRFPEWIGAGDFNEDQVLDLVTVNRISHDVSILFGKPGGGFSLAESRVDLPESFGLRAKDVVAGWDRDEFAIENENDDLASIYFFPRRLTTGDFNNDHHVDLVVTNDVAMGFSVFLGIGDGRFQPEIWFSTPGDPEFACADDFDGDGNLDLVFVHDHEGKISVWLGKGNGSFDQYGDPEIDDGPENAVVGDFNADGKPDLSVEVNGDEVTIYHGDGKGGFGTPSSKKGKIEPDERYPLPVQPRGILAQDFDGDEILDLAVVSDAEGVVTILLRNEDGTRKEQPAQAYQLGDKNLLPRSIAADDLNGDQNIDLVISALSRQEIWVLWGTGNGQFEAPVAVVDDETRINTTADAQSTPIAIVDLDGDKNLDLVTIDRLHDQVSVWYGEGDGKFADRQTSIEVTGHPLSLAVADVDADGDQDLIVGNGSSYDVAVLLNPGSRQGIGSWQELRFGGDQRPALRIPVEENVDWNGDGIGDLLEVNRNRSEVQVTISGASGESISTHQLVDIQGTLHIADLDGGGQDDLIQVTPDGRIRIHFDTGGEEKGSCYDHPDLGIRDLTVLQQGESVLLAAIVQDASGSRIQLYRASPDPEHVLERVPTQLPGGTFLTRITAGDVDGDGHDDLVTIDAATQSLYVHYWNQDEASFSDSLVVPLPGSVPGEVTLLDVAGIEGPTDGLLDIIITNEDSGDLIVLRNLGPDDRFEPMLRLRTSDGLQSVSTQDSPIGIHSSAQPKGTTTADLNGDGRLDLIVTNSGLNSIAIFLSKPNGGFADPISLMTGSGPSIVQVAQLNDDTGDGQIDQNDWLDLVVLNEEGEEGEQIWIYFSENEHLSSADDFQTPSTFGAGHLPNGLTVHDDDGDGIPDLIVGNREGDYFVLYGKLSAGTMVYQPNAFSPEPNVALALLDVDEDGEVDAILADEEGRRVWIADADDPSVKKEINGRPKDRPFAPGAVEIAQLDADEKDDILVLNRASNQLLVYRGAGTGNFEEALIFPTGTRPKSMAIGDVNGDGLLDVVVVNEGSNDISVLLGDKNRLLRKGVRLEVEGSPVDVVIGDFTKDADGQIDTIKDLLVTCKNINDDENPANGVYLLQGLGRGFFDDQHPTFYKTGEDPVQSLVGHFDDQPGLDLVTLNLGSQDVTIHSDFFDPSVQAATLRPQAAWSSELFLPRAGVLYDASQNGLQDLFIASQNGSIWRLDSSMSAGSGALKLVAKAEEVVRVLKSERTDSTGPLEISAIDVVSKPSWEDPSAGLRLAVAGVRDNDVVLGVYEYAPGEQGNPNGRSRDKLPYLNEPAEDSTAEVPELDPESDPDRPIEEILEDISRTNVWDSTDLLGVEEPTTESAGPGIDELEPDSDGGASGSDSTEPPEDFAGQEGDLIGPFVEQAEDLLFWSIDQVLEYFELPLAPESVYELVAVAVSDLRTMLTMLTDPETPQPVGDSLLTQWWAVYGDDLARWYDAHPDAPLIRLAGLVGMLWNTSEIANESSPSDPNPPDAKPTIPGPDPNSDRIFWSTLGAAGIILLVYGVRCWRRRPRRKRLPELLAIATTVDRAVEDLTGETVWREFQYLPECLGEPCELIEGDAMSRPMKDLLPESWWEVNRCVDEYEAAAESGFPDLRQLTGSVAPQYRAAACLELAAVDMEHRFKADQPVMVEEYLFALPEIQSDGSSVDELILEEYQLRRRRGETPPFSEYRQRFPQHDIDRVLGSDPDVTQPLSSGTKPGISPLDVAPPEMIGRYEVRREIGRGAFGRVYQCFDAQLHREVAIKLSHPGKHLSGSQIQDYLHEARGVARLHHPGIVSVLDTGELDDGRGYVVYEYVAGQTLRQRFLEGYYTRDEALRWCIELAEALHHAHLHEVVHRDVTPSNVLIDQEGHARLTDFGLARVADRFYRDDSGRMVGTLTYMSPEAAVGDSSWASSQSDIYSLGVILYELLTRRRPFDNGCCGLQELRDQIVRRIPQPPRTIDETISKGLEQVCLRAMAKSPADRYTTAADLADALREAVTPQPPPQKSPWRFRWLGAAAAVLLLLTMAGLVVPRIMNGVEPVVQIDEPHIQLFLHRVGEPEPIVLTDVDDESWDLPIRDDDGLRLNVRLNIPGYVYILFVPEHGTPEMIYPRNAEHTSPEKISELWCPEDPLGELRVKPNEEYGLEMLLVVVTDDVLDANELAALQALPFRPTDDARRACRYRVLKVPVPKDEEQVMTRGLEERPIVERYLEGFAPAVDQLPLRCWRVTIYRHARK